MTERTLVVGDIHGLYDPLMRSLEHARYADSDRLIFLGDYINRGGQSREVLDLLVQLDKRPRNVFLKGNHEEMVLKLLAGRTDYWYTWLGYGGGSACLESYGFDSGRILSDGAGYTYREGRTTVSLSDAQATTQFVAGVFPKEHLDFMLRTTVMHETERFYFSHAGIESGVSLKAQKAYADCFMTWGDNTFIGDDTAYEKVVIFGHYHLEAPLVRSNRACIALKDSVGVLDLEARVVWDSEGRVTKIPKALWR